LSFKVPKIVAILVQYMVMLNDSVMHYSADLILLDLDVTMGYRTTYYKSTVLVSPHHAEGSSLYYFCCLHFLLFLIVSSFRADSLLHTGAAWVRIGELRFRLLLSSYSPDPTFKSTYKHSHIVEKITLVKLEEKVKHL